MRRYLAVPHPADHDGVRLLCFHHAGAGALSFAGWQRRMGDRVRVLPVRLPGRETRLREPGVTDGGALVAELESELGPLLREPHAFYGHSLGALVAYRFALHRARAGLRPPSVLLAGACNAPHTPASLLAGLDPERAPDDELLRAANEAAPLPGPLLRHRARLGALLTALRADLRLARSLRAAPVAPLPCPVEAFAGRQDAMVPAHEMWAWRDCTSAGFRLRTGPGAHFFVRGPELPHIVRESLSSAAALPAGR